MEQLRALVSLYGWEFCVLWKLSKDQRYLEFKDCCCAGAETYIIEPGFVVSQCRDALVPHSKTKACDVLAQFPPFLHIDDTGVYAETLISNQPECIHLSLFTNSGDMEAEVATRLLIPVQGGLAELFAASARQVSENHQLIDFIAENCNFPIEEESLFFSDEFVNQLCYSSVETGGLDLISEDETDDAKYKKKNGKEPQSKNLIAERKRRKKLNERLYKLRSLVPIISKLDRASTLGDAIDFVKELQKQKKDLEEQLQQKSNDELEYDGNIAGQYQRQPEVDVFKIEGSSNVLFVKLLHEKKASGFVRLLECLDLQGLEVIDVNVATFGTLVSCVLQVQGKDGRWGMVEEEFLKNILIGLICEQISLKSYSTLTSRSVQSHTDSGPFQHFEKRINSDNNGADHNQQKGNSNVKILKEFASSEGPRLKNS